MVKFGYAITYVDDVKSTVEFFEKAFDMKRRFIHEGGDYGELDTGETVLAFASHSLGEANLPHGYINATTSDKPLGTEIALVTDDVKETHQAAIRNGGSEIKAPEEKPWGQTVSYVRTPSGILLELCSPM
ncbi:VOC family protein [Hahella ganghwensis]|uniref:VOC family protein n=1 Tax=Hahella ganghwensis TaxID=286420 RepID=UPI00037AD770|nr:VOC family protein [Hahella ganghwensis]